MQDPSDRDPPRTRYLDSAQVLSVVSRAAPVLLAPGTIFFIGTRLSRELQGYHYTFSSLVALQSFIELGLSLVLVNVISHEWAHLSIGSRGEVTGDPRAAARLAGIGRFAFRWYVIASGLLTVLLAFAGRAFLSTGAIGPEVWGGPWMALSAAAGLQLLTVPALAVLEGCNQVRSVYAVRTGQVVVSSLALWTALLADAGLWAAAVAMTAGSLTVFIILAFTKRRFWRLFLAGRGAEVFSWKADVLPLQWRLAVQGLVNYFAFQLFNPVVFHYHGAVAAGQMGMTLSLLNAVGRVGYSTVEARIPTLGMLAARREFDALDRTYRQATLVSLTLVLLGSAGVIGGVLVLGAAAIEFRARLLDVPATTFLAVATVLMGFGQCRSAYLRAHKRDPQVFLSVSSSILIGGAVWILGRAWGALGTTAGYATVVALYLIPLQTAIFRRSRREFRA